MVANVRDDAAAVRFWLRLFTTTTLVERRLGAAFKRTFGSSLPRFDLLAQLDRVPEGLRMTELSERLLVTGGNVTWLVGQLVREGLVERRRAEADGRVVVVTLTPQGRRQFHEMARAHARWIAELTAGLSVADRERVSASLAELKAHILTLEGP